METKRKLFCDFDGCITNSIEKVVSLYDKDFKLYRDYKKIHWTDINTYEFTELALINKNIVLDYFDDHRFFQDLPYMDNAKEVLDKLKDEFEIIICSIGRPKNLRLKREFCENNFPYAQFVGVPFYDNNDKSKVNMNFKGSILIDDCVSNLNTCDAETRLIFGEKYHWNAENVNGYKRVWNWTEVEKILMK